MDVPEHIKFPSQSWAAWHGIDIAETTDDLMDTSRRASEQARALGSTEMRRTVEVTPVVEGLVAADIHLKDATARSGNVDDRRAINLPVDS